MLDRMRKAVASDLMNRNVKFIREDASLLDAVRKMKEFEVSSLMVESANKADGFGIVTRKDLINKLIDPDPGSQHALVADIMTMPAIMVPPNMSVMACVRLMKRCNIRRLPISDGKQVIGILSNSDIFKKFYPGPSIE
ncbi:MAG: CBS domain-containing protein [Candidatus Abyssobacteria bacterium SURF_5]|uniref:CBS domain-containing protein n=1 Tax=Abyssobacteria bacterium (strain SURF_5) TaxID=2093360 RepID=A0A3A4P3S3_ABYX5|nr:MAG: CBS domain-containing protein [Candidatus Abyssubacteria bacterium SURF_5]